LPRHHWGDEAEWELTYPNNNTATYEQIEGIQQWLDELAAALERRTADPEDGVFALLDQDAVIDWMIVQEFARNIDAYKLSVHLYKDVGEPARIVPWDFDLSFGQPLVDSDEPRPRDMGVSSGWVTARPPFIQDLFAVPGFAEQLAERWRALRKHELADERIFSLIDGYLEVLEPELEANFNRWPLEDVAFEHIYAPFSLYDVDSHATEVEYLRGWISDRVEWIDANIDSLAD